MFAEVDGRRIEVRMLPGDAALPVFVFLHEGLGCVALWRDVPDKLARRLGMRALVYSRFGYGRSDGLLAKRTPRFMHEEALDVLPKLLDRFAISRPVLVGHSDGASIALIHTANAGLDVAGLVLLAPHVFVEDITIESIARVRQTYKSTDLRARLSKYHAHVDDAFLGWSEIWLDPAFRGWSIEAEAARIAAPTLLIQGLDDEYGTPAQIERITELARGPVTQARLENCGHAPHRDQEAAVLDAIQHFVKGLGPDRSGERVV